MVVIFILISCPTITVAWNTRIEGSFNCKPLNLPLPPLYCSFLIVSFTRRIFEKKKKKRSQIYFITWNVIQMTELGCYTAPHPRQSHLSVWPSMSLPSHPRQAFGTNSKCPDILLTAPLFHIPSVSSMIIIEGYSSVNCSDDQGWSRGVRPQEQMDHKDSFLFFFLFSKNLIWNGKEVHFKK